MTIASAPRSASSLPTWALTNSTRRRSTDSPLAWRTCCSCVRTSSASVPGCGGRRTRTSVSLPKRCTCASVNPAAPRLLRIASRLAACGYPTSRRMPPVKSMPKSRPRVASDTSDATTSSSDIASAILRRLTLRKSIFVVLLIIFMIRCPTPVSTRAYARQTQG